jgi:uncharacterized membrane protein YedE/YeeE
MEEFAGTAMVEEPIVRKRLRREKTVAAAEDKGWSPYLAGALSGLVLVLSVWIAGKFFGASTTFVRSAGLLGSVVAPEQTAGNAYFLKTLIKIDWQMLFVIGIFFGALIASLTSGTFKWQAVPDMWQTRFGESPVLRGVVAFIGGGVALFGARLAGGCPSGHGISGSLQMSISGLIALAFFFIGAVLMARMVYGGGTKP